MNSLNVELYGSLLGTLVQRNTEIDFKVDSKVFEKFSVASNIMSLAVPLTPRFTTQQKRKYRNFFSELLPEGRNLNWILRTIPVEERNTFGILKKYGRDIAGALMIYDPSAIASSKKPAAEKIDSKGIRFLLENMAQEPLANSPLSGKTSLGGVQGKIVLAKKDSHWHRTHYGYPSTHIVKPVVPEYTTMIYDEAFCMQLAFALGLTNHPVWIEDFSGADALVIERYDRSNNIDNGRIHQEDFNQILGAHGDEKYQEYGGKVSAKRIAGVLERFCREDIERFASQLIFSIAVGNLDMHAKNISVIHYPDQVVNLAPVYDQVPLRHQGTDGRMALSIGGEYNHATLTVDHIVKEITSWNTLRFPDEKEANSFVLSNLESFYSALENTDACQRAYPSLKKELSTFVTNLLNGKRIE
jgi:serine/threonine-protein kinase HipA